MKIIVGLGNPGEKYGGTRHNCGFEAAEAIRLSFGFADFKSNKKLCALVSKGDFDGEKIILAMPQTFMNESGKTACSALSYYRAKPEDLWLVYDDIDLTLGDIRLRQSGSSGGHKGIQSVISRLKTEDFPRIRIGIGAASGERKIPAEKFVLQRFSEKEKKIIGETVGKIPGIVRFALEKGMEKAMGEFN